MSGVPGPVMPRGRMTNTAGSRAIRGTNRTASRGRRVPGPKAAAATRRVRDATTTVRGATNARAAVGVCTRVRAAPAAGVRRTASASGR